MTDFNQGGPVSGPRPAPKIKSDPQAIVKQVDRHEFRVTVQLSWIDTYGVWSRRTRRRAERLARRKLANLLDEIAWEKEKMIIKPEDL